MNASKLTFDEEPHLCRLCGELQDNVIEFCGESSDDFVTLIRGTLGYLNLEFVDDKALPNWLCAPCHIDAESTKKFLVMVEEGQRKLRQIIEERNLALGTSSSLKRKRKSNLAESVPADGPQNTKTPIKLHNKTDDKIIANKEVPIDVLQTPEADSFTSNYRKRKRKPTKRFPCDPTPYSVAEEFASDNDTDSKCDNSAAMRPGTLITIKPIAELCAENGTSLAEMIAVDTEEPQQVTSNESEIRLVCEYCKDVFTTQHLFLKHLRTHNETNYECAECENIYETLAELKKHQMLKTHKGKSILAKSKTRTSAGTQEKSTKANTTISIVMDDDEEIASAEHEATTTDEVTQNYVIEQIAENRKGFSRTKTAYKCLKCKKLYSSHYSVLRHHKQVHVGARIFKCEHCSASFAHSNTLTYHMAKHTGIRNNKCDICSKEFVHRHELTLHMRTHTGDKPYICKHCPKAFAHRSNLVTHMRLHTGQLPFKCETCGARFNSSSHWKLHKERHLKHAQKLVESRLNGDKCAVVVKHKKLPTQTTSSTVADPMTPPPTTSLLRPKEMIVKSVKILPPINALPGPNATIDSKELKNIILKSLPAETATKPIAPLRFECKQCLQRFKLRSALTKHLRTHTGEKPYRCSLCPRTFADASNFKRHKSLHKTATEQLQNVSKQMKAGNFLNELQRERTKSLSQPIVPLSPTHSNASDPDPDGLEAIARTNATMSTESVIDFSSADDDDDGDEADLMLAILDDVAEESLQQLASTTKVSNAVSLRRPIAPASSVAQQLVCISHANPTNPSDNKTTTFYL